MVQESQMYFSIKPSELNTDAPRLKKTPFIAFKQEKSLKKMRLCSRSNKNTVVFPDIKKRVLHPQKKILILNIVLQQSQM